MIDMPLFFKAIEDLLSELEHEAPRAEEVRVENANFLVDEDEDANVDAMMDSLFGGDDEEGQ
jgi:hypothetical protein